MLVACLPFVGRGGHQAFWQHNRRILYRWLEGALYAASLFLGLALALAALDQLFGVDVPSRAYGYLWVLCTLLFHPLFFLAGVPSDYEALERDDTYPGGLRAFANFVLVPLTILYLVILTAYFVKVVVTGQWPSGWIGWLVSGAATLGILTLLLTSPPSALERPAWVRQFERWFWPALLPAALMVGLAVWQRVAQYGLTERRYFLAALALWLGAVALAFTLRRARPLILIPASLAAVALLTFAGPWGAYRASERSQLGRLERLLGELGMLSDGRITPAAPGLERDGAVQAANVAGYLAETHGSRRFGAWLEARGIVVRQRGDSVALPEAPEARGARGRNRERGFQRAALEALGLSGLARRPQEMVWVPAPPGRVLDVRGWERLVPVEGPVVPQRPWPSGDSLAGRLGADGRSVELRRGGTLLLRVELGELFDSLAAWWLGSPPEQRVPEARLAQPAEGAGVAALVWIHRVGLRDSAGVWRASSFDGEALIRFP